MKIRPLSDLTNYSDAPEIWASGGMSIRRAYLGRGRFRYGLIRGGAVVASVDTRAAVMALAARHRADRDRPQDAPAGA